MFKNKFPLLSLTFFSLCVKCLDQTIEERLMELFARERSTHSRSKEKNLAFAFWLRSLGTSHWARNYLNFPMIIMPNQSNFCRAYESLRKNQSNFWKDFCPVCWWNLISVYFTKGGGDLLCPTVVLDQQKHFICWHNVTIFI